jgi:hypothetical protein
MSREFTLDLIETKKELLYVAGVSLTALATTETFSQMNEYRKKNKQKRADIALCIEAIILDGEPVERIEAQTSAMLVLSGDWQALIDAAKMLKWQGKGERLLRTNDTVLTLSDETA